MASTYSNIGIELQGTGENANTWGTKTNTNFEIIDERLSEIHTLTNTSSFTLSAPAQGTKTQEERYATLKFTGSASGDVTVTLPAKKFVYNVLNYGSDGTGIGHNLIFRGPNAATVTATVKNGKSGSIHSDGDESVYLLSNTGSEAFNTDITAKTSDGALLKLQTSHTTIAADDVLGSVQFNAPDETNGADGDARLIGAEVAAVAEGTFSDTSNATKLSFKTGSSEAATEKMKLSSAGVLSIPADGSGTSSNSIVLGAGSDMQIFHDGSNSYVQETGTGFLALKGSSVHLQSSGGETMLNAETDGAVSLYYDNSAKIATASGGATITGAITATGNITAFFSDERLKDIHGSIENALDKVCQLDGFIYSPNDDAESLGYKKTDRIAGISAQQCEKVLPEAVVEAPISSYFKAVQYDQLIPLLINAIKELKAELDDHKKGCQCNGSNE